MPAGDPHDPVAEATPYAPQPWIGDACPSALSGRPWEVVTAIVADIRAGLPLSRIIRRHSVSSSVIRIAAKELGWQRRGLAHLTELETTRIRDRYAAGDAVREIAREADVRATVIEQVLQARGWSDAAEAARARVMHERLALIRRLGPRPPRKRSQTHEEAGWWQPPTQAPSPDAPQRPLHEVAVLANQLWTRGLSFGHIATKVGVRRPFLRWVMSLYRGMDQRWFAPRDR